MKKVMLLVGAGQIGMAIARRVGTGMKIIVGDKKTENTENVAAILNNAGFDAFPVETDLSDRASIQSMRRISCSLSFFAKIRSRQL